MHCVIYCLSEQRTEADGDVHNIIGNSLLNELRNVLPTIPTRQMAAQFTPDRQRNR